MIKDIFEDRPRDRALLYIALAERAEKNAASADGTVKESFAKLAVEWRHLAAVVKPGPRP